MAEVWGRGDKGKEGEFCSLSSVFDAQLPYASSRPLYPHTCFTLTLYPPQAWKWEIRKKMWDYMEANDIAR